MRALIVTGKYAQDIEVYYPLYRMQEEGWDVDICTPDGKECQGVYGMPIRPTMGLPKNTPVEFPYGVLILPGGARALEYLRTNPEVLLTINRYISYTSGIIGSICHGTQLLISCGCVKGRKISGYYSIKDDITNAGGRFIDAPFVTDGRIVSSPHYKYLGPWMKEVIRYAHAYKPFP
jgi:protease I